MVCFHIGQKTTRFGGSIVQPWLGQEPLITRRAGEEDFDDLADGQVGAARRFSSASPSLGARTRNLN